MPSHAVVTCKKVGLLFVPRRFRTLLGGGLRRSGLLTLVLLIWLMAIPGIGFCETPAQPPVETAKPKTWWVEPQARWWLPTLHAKTFSSAGGASGSSLNLDSDLGVKTSRNFIWPILTAQLAERHRVVFSYLPMQFGGNRNLTQTTNIAGFQFQAGASINSVINVTDASITYQYEFLRAAPGSAHVNLQGRYLEMNSRYQVTSGGSTVDINKPIVFPLPTIGGGLRTNPWHGLSLSGDFNVFKLGISGFKGQLIDSQIGLTFNPLALWKSPPRELCSTLAPTLCLPFSPDELAISTGYRYFRATATTTANMGQTSMDWIQQGPYFDISIRF